MAKTAWDKALALLNRRALNRRLLTEKIIAAGFPPDEAREAVERAVKAGFVDDELLAEDYARAIAQGGAGSFRIRRKLQDKQFDRATVERAVAAQQESETERARQVFELKLRLLARENDWRKKRDKMFRHLISRGFPVAVAQELCREIKPESCPEC